MWVRSDAGKMCPPCPPRRFGQSICEAIDRGVLDLPGLTLQNRMSSLRLAQLGRETFSAGVDFASVDRMVSRTAVCGYRGSYDLAVLTGKRPALAAADLAREDRVSVPANRR